MVNEADYAQTYQIIEAFTDYKTYLLALFSITTCIPNGGISNFGTLIIRGM